MLWCLWEGKDDPPHEPTENRPLPRHVDCPPTLYQLMLDGWVENADTRPTMELMLVRLKGIAAEMYS